MDVLRDIIEEKDLKVTKVKKTEEGYLVYVDYNPSSLRCKHCGSSRVWRNGRDKERKKFFGEIEGRKVYLVIRRQKYLCGDCKRTVTVMIKELPPWKRFTLSLALKMLAYLEDHSIRDCALSFSTTFYSVTRLLRDLKLGVFWDLLKELDEIRLAIDAHRFHKRKMAYLVVELNTRFPIAIIPASKKDVMRFLLSMPGWVKEKLKEVVMDMTLGLKKWVKDNFPGVKVVVDKFHLVSYMNRLIKEEKRTIEQVDRVRINGRVLVKAKERLKKKEKAKLKGILAQYDTLAFIYTCKEKIREMYGCGSKDEAEGVLDGIISSLLKYPDPVFKKAGRTLKRWKDEILNYFDNRSTTAVVEGYHRKIKLLQRISYGIRNWDTYHNKMLLGLWGDHKFKEKIKRKIRRCA